MRASVEAGGSGLLQFSQVGRSCSMAGDKDTAHPVTMPKTTHGGTAGGVNHRTVFRLIIRWRRLRGFAFYFRGWWE
jgi:hypothetical protein